ncbi:MAG: hypothetical protein IPH16_06450 [Haliscomenobacter sp.]|nr:hypothetical protein [Haliscomenobacter sp.]
MRYAFYVNKICFRSDGTQAPSLGLGQKKSPVSGTLSFIFQLPEQQNPAIPLRLAVKVKAEKIIPVGRYSMHKCVWLCGKPKD